MLDTNLLGEFPSWFRIETVVHGSNIMYRSIMWVKQRSVGHFRCEIQLQRERERERGRERAARGSKILQRPGWAQRRFARFRRACEGDAPSITEDGSLSRHD